MVRWTTSTRAVLKLPKFWDIRINIKQIHEEKKKKLIKTTRNYPNERKGKFCDTNENLKKCEVTDLQRMTQYPHHPMRHQWLATDDPSMFALSRQFSGPKPRPLCPSPLTQVHLPDIPHSVKSMPMDQQNLYGPTVF